MELSVNYMEEVKELYEEGKIDFVDYFKLFSINGDLSPFDWCAERKKVLFHGMTGDGSNIARKDFLENRDYDLQKRYFEKSRVPYISFHISAGSNYELENEEDTIKTIKRNVEGIRKIFDYDILLENSPVRKGNTPYYFISRPEFIKRVIEETNTYFLLDISHARAAAYSLDIPYQEYIDALPLEKIREIHLSGCVKNKAGDVIANHSKMNEEDFEILNYLLGKSKSIQVLTLEMGPYDPDTDEMIPAYGKIVPELKQEVYENLIKLKEIMGK